MEIKFTTEFVPLPEDAQARTLPRINKELGNARAPGPHRDDAVRLQAFSQHVSIAHDLAGELASWRERFDRAMGSGGSAEAASTAAQEIGSKWEMLWSQLDDARALADGLGADVSAYDRARAAARDLTSGAAIVEIGEWHPDEVNGRKRTVRFRVPRVAQAQQAIAALTRAVPEARIVRQPDAPDLRTVSQRIPWTWIVVAIVAAAAILHFR